MFEDINHLQLSEVFSMIFNEQITIKNNPMIITLFMNFELCNDIFIITYPSSSQYVSNGS